MLMPFQLGKIGHICAGYTIHNQIVSATLLVA
jgi:hypothetical protein